MRVHTKHVPPTSLCSGLFSSTTGRLVGGEQREKTGEEHAKISIGAFLLLFFYSTLCLVHTIDTTDTAKGSSSASFRKAATE